MQRADVNPPNLEQLARAIDELVVIPQGMGWFRKKIRSLSSKRLRDLLPLEDRKYSMPERCAVLAAIRDTNMGDGKIDPWINADGPREGAAYRRLCDNAEGLEAKCDFKGVSFSRTLSTLESMLNRVKQELDTQRSKATRRTSKRRDQKLDTEPEATGPIKPPSESPSPATTIPANPIPITWLREQVTQKKVKGDASKLAKWLERRGVNIFKVAQRNHAERDDLLKCFKTGSKVHTLIANYDGE